MLEASNHHQGLSASVKKQHIHHNYFLLMRSFLVSPKNECQLKTMFLKLVLLFNHFAARHQMLPKEDLTIVKATLKQNFL